MNRFKIFCSAYITLYYINVAVHDMKEKSRCPLENSDFIKYIPHPIKERNDNLNFEYMKTRFIA